MPTVVIVPNGYDLGHAWAAVKVRAYRVFKSRSVDLNSLRRPGTSPRVCRCDSTNPGEPANRSLFAALTFEIGVLSPPSSASAVAVLETA